MPFFLLMLLLMYITIAIQFNKFLVMIKTVICFNWKLLGILFNRAVV